MDDEGIWEWVVKLDTKDWDGLKICGDWYGIMSSMLSVVMG